jgi:hypothetical protein
MKLSSEHKGEIIIEHDGHAFHIFLRNLNNVRESEVGESEKPLAPIGYYVENGLFMPIYKESLYGNMIERYLLNHDQKKRFENFMGKMVDGIEQVENGEKDSAQISLDSHR